MWNVRGLNSDTKQRDVKWFLHHSEVILFGLLETRVKLGSLNKVAINICNGWSYTTNNNCHAGKRIWVLWKSQYLKVDIVERDDQYIHLKIKDTIDDYVFYVTFVYGFNRVGEREPLWNALQSWNITEPWVVLGDFNNVMRLQADPRNTILMDIEYQSRESYLMLAKARDDYLRQKAKCNWAKEGDTNSAMFYRIIKHRQIQNKVLRIEDAMGRICTTPDDILYAFVHYYEHLLRSNASTNGFHSHIVNHGKKVSNIASDKLCQIPSNDEIKQVVFSIPDDKSLGPDGFTSTFFKASWGTIREDFCKAIRDFFLSGQLLK
ncbi:uncharacterized protein LOC141617638 [Silene latifolia]|uniref:uncharacterized protein LOC141617638 n=1 Tax=Silene latifolia TaxID=37657 RepID=UPI003D783731